eukprot:CAMPEP_0182418788 /NCGR_PEP_ID=MMETSP1167-20130531/3162_1 /TAXON_ID=2988 /ORGANISM="Mallomonas Sp, Strain CCMP3275" /LENGTH=595 /DNA_ID=CAMNT_0024593177 /DNA_START=860 /DNA_END=2647 /DNA_ORIENTATION=-
MALPSFDLPSTVLKLNSIQLSRLAEIYQLEVGKSHVMSKISLSLVQGEVFRSSLDLFLRENLITDDYTLQDIYELLKQTNPLKPSRKEFISDSIDYWTHPVMKLAIQLLNGYLTNLRLNGTFDSSQSTEKERERTDSLPRVLYLLSYLYELCGRFSEALQLINEAIHLCPPTVIMRYKKIEILKKCGDLIGASSVMEECHQLESSSRNIDIKSTEQSLQVDNTTLIGDVPTLASKPVKDLESCVLNLQCIEYEVEIAEKYVQMNQFISALKKLNEIKTYLLNYLEDLFSFQSSLNKSPVQTCLEVFTITKNPFAYQSVQRVIQSALTLLLQRHELITVTDREKTEKQLQSEVLSGEELSDEKLGEKEMLQELQRWEDFAAMGRKSVLGHYSSGARPGKCYVNPDTQALLCESAIRRDELAVALRALFMGLQVAPLHPRLIFQIVRLANLVINPPPIASSMQGIRKPIVEEVLKEQLHSLLHGTDVVSYVSLLVDRVVDQENWTTLQHRIVVAKCILLLDPSETGREKAGTLLAGETEKDLLQTGRGVDYITVLEAYTFLQETVRLTAYTERFKTRAALVFPLAKAFGGDNKGATI